MRMVLKVCLLLFFAIILLEVLTRVFDIYPEYGFSQGMFQKDDLLGYSMTPNFTGKFIKQEFKIDVFTNSLGLRDVEYSKKADHDFRILALGDSFTWGGYGVSLEQTFVKVLQRKLNNNFKKVTGLNYQVINAGVSGYGANQELPYLIERGSKLKPDLVMLNFTVGNDFLDNIQFGEMTVRDGRLVEENFQMKTTESLRWFLVNNSQFYRVLEKELINHFQDLIKKYFKPQLQREQYQTQLFLLPTNPKINNEIVKTKDLLVKMKTFLNSNNVKFVIVILPFNYQVDDKLKADFIKYNYSTNDYIDLELPQKSIKQWASENDVLVIDLLPEFKRLNMGGDLFWPLNDHFNVKGNEVAGEIIYQKLISISLKPK